MNDSAQPLLLNIEDPLDRQSGRPRFRSECYEARTLIDDDGDVVREMTASGPGKPVLGPCPWATCRWHTAQVRPRCNGRRVHPALVPDITGWAITCVLDVTDRGPATLETVGKALGVTRERARQLEMKALSLFRSKERNLLEGFIAKPEPDSDPVEMAIRLRRGRSSVNTISTLLGQAGHRGWTPARVKAMLIKQGEIPVKPASSKTAEKRCGELLHTTGRYMLTAEVAEHMGCSTSYASLLLKNLREMGRVETLVNPGKSSRHRWVGGE